MADRNFEHGTNYGKGLVWLEFSFLANGASNPVSSGYRGVGTDVIKSITYTATGKYTIVLRDKFRYIICGDAGLWDIASPDGGYASFGNVSNEGSSTVGPTFVVATFSAAGTLTQFSARRVNVTLCLKNSTVGV